MSTAVRCYKCGNDRIYFQNSRKQYWCKSCYEVAVMKGEYIPDAPRSAPTPTSSEPGGAVKLACPKCDFTIDQQPYIKGDIYFCAKCAEKWGFPVAKTTDPNLTKAMKDAGIVMMPVTAGEEKVGRIGASLKQIRTEAFAVRFANAWAAQIEEREAAFQQRLDDRKAAPTAQSKTDSRSDSSTSSSAPTSKKEK